MTSDRREHRRPPALACALALTALAAPAVAAEPAQEPLLQRAAVPPKPNVMVTLDDSGSMQMQFLPEGAFSVNGRAVRLPSQYDPLVRQTYFQDDAYGDPSHASYGGPSGSVTALRVGAGVYQMQFRSPEVNALYYNPDRRYLPWLLPQGPAGARYAPADPAAALWDPVRPGAGSFKLNVAGDNLQDKVWCTAHDRCEAGLKAFAPGLVYRLAAGADPSLASSYTRFDVNVDGEHAPTVKQAARTDCAGTRCTQAEELRNFANWFQYHRSRELMTRAAVTEVLARQIGRVRLGWGSLNKTVNGAGPDNLVDGVANDTVRVGVAELDAAQFATVAADIQQSRSNDGTPLRRAVDDVGRYFQRADANSPWRTRRGEAPAMACRRAVHLLLTDGYYNDAISLPDQDSVDGPDHAANNPLGRSPTRYVARRPFIDGPVALAGTLADVAMKYYVDDLQPGLDNRVPADGGDIAYWQHLTHHAVGLGVRGRLDASTPESKARTLAALLAGRLDWPAPDMNDLPTLIDDLWHAAVDTGGDFFAVNDPAALADALFEALDRSVGSVSQAGGVATSGSTLAAGTLKFVPSYKSPQWTGDLAAYALNGSGRIAGAAPVWLASAQRPAFDKRLLYTWNGRAALPFTWDAVNADAATLKALGEAASPSFVDYIRGDKRQEGASGPFRARAGALPDFVDAAPRFVKDAVDLSYDRLGGDAGAGYRAFVNQKKARATGAVFIGGNGGMLHAFRASDGVEVFGFLPRAGLARLPLIAQPDYGTATNFHRFFVDGPLVETDGFVALPGGAAPAWANLLLGSMGAGGTGLFALKLPTADPTALDAQAVLWEKSGADDADIGHVLAPMQAGRVQGAGPWVALAGNGVDSASGQTALLVFDLASGALLKKLVVAPGTGPGGLMGVTLVRNATQEVVAAYAGDLQGRLWRFDFKGPSPADWVVGFKGQPLVTALDGRGSPQPISAPPAFLPHAQAGHVVLFGTGRLIDAADADSVAPQSFYGVWDKTPAGAASDTADSPFKALARARDALVEQVIDPVARVAAAGRYFGVSSNAVDWGTRLGWVMDLPFAGARVLQPPTLIGDFVYIGTVVPAASTNGCESAVGVGYNFLLPARDGAQGASAVFDTGGDGVVDGSDAVVSGFQAAADGADAVVFVAGDPRRGVIEDGGDGGQTFRAQCLLGCSLVIQDRVWKQIVTPPTP